MAGRRGALLLILVLFASGGDRTTPSAGRRIDRLSHLAVAATALETPPQFAPVTAANFHSGNLLNIPQLLAMYPAHRGETVQIAVFDEGSILRGHPEFDDGAGRSRVELHTRLDPAVHATHVAGTIAARGVDREALGISPAANVLSFDWQDDLQNLAQFADRIDVSNHSYTPSAGWTFDGANGRWSWWGEEDVGTEDPRFGKYGRDAAALDVILYARPTLLSVVAAGNFRAPVGPPDQPWGHLEFRLASNGVTTSQIWSQAVRGYNDQTLHGYDTTAGLCTAKNAICVGAVQGQQGNILSAPFSSWGPADDGRIKPDVVASGHAIHSPTFEMTSDGAKPVYAELDGTSMATPAVAGTFALLKEAFHAEYNSTPSSAVLRAVVIHTATDLGLQGPDPVYGWGIPNALRAGEMIRAHAARELHIEARPLILTFVGTPEPVKVTVAWADPPAAANAQGLNDRTPALVNDIDCVLIGQGGERYYPFSLDAQHPERRATATGPNHVDNVEVIEPRDTPRPGYKWNLEVNATLRRAWSQEFALVVSGLKALDDPARQ